MTQEANIAAQLAAAVVLRKEQKKTVEALALMESLLQQAVETHGPLDPASAEFYFQYGSTLLLRAEELADLFGDKMAKDAAARDAAKKAEAEAKAAAEKAAAAAAEEPGGASAGAGNEDAAGADADGDAEAQAAAASPPEPLEDPNELLEIAFECLDVARVIYGRSEESADQLMLAKVHTRIGDLSLEISQFDQGIEAYQQALNIRLGLLVREKFPRLEKSKPRRGIAY